MNILLDSHALIELLSGSPAGAKVKKIYQECEGAFTTSANLYEVKYRLADIAGEKTAQAAIDETLVFVKSIAIDDRIALKASLLKRKHAGKGMGAVDFFVLSAAQLHGLKIVSGDPHFRGMQNILFIE